ncbi:MAG: transcriptional repressor, partial [Oscillospiraceae bacterium]|nr:transcriptional repressor [Oscillospiraceae bacterium]
HQHIICRCCGSVMDWRIPKMEELDQYLSELTGFAVDRHDFIAWGTCKNCQN